MRWLAEFFTDPKTWAILAGVFAGHVIANEVRPVDTPVAVAVAVVCFVVGVALDVRRELRDV